MIRFLRKQTLVLLMMLSASVSVQANDNLHLDVCVFDIIGRSGDGFQMAKDFAFNMREYDVRLNLMPYTDESVALADFSAGDCDVLVATDLRTRRFNRFAGSVSAVGAVPSYAELRTILQVLSSPNAADRMSTDEYEILGIFPLGAGFLFVTDEAMADVTGTPTVRDLAGQRIATLDYQSDAVHMVNYVNASVVPADITSFGGMFNNRSVDAAYSPAFGYEALELYRGIGDGGGIVRYPLAQLTAQVVVRKGVVEPELAQASREEAFAMFDEAMALIRQFEDRVPEEHWIDIPEEDIEDYQEMFRQNRIEMRGEIYDGDMLTLMRRVRCRENPSASECTASDRE